MNIHIYMNSHVYVNSCLVCSITISLLHSLIHLQVIKIHTCLAVVRRMSDSSSGDKDTHLSCCGKKDTTTK
jgi:hypothetical protein